MIIKHRDIFGTFLYHPAAAARFNARIRERLPDLFSGPLHRLHGRVAHYVDEFEDLRLELIQLKEGDGII